MSINKFNKELIDYLKYYVYLYLDPDTNEVFYVGKGKGNRVFNHLNDIGESEKARRIQDIQSRGKTPKIEILIHGLEEEESALKVEAAVIDLIGVDKLTNRVHGYRSSLYGRLTIEQLLQRYHREIAEIAEPAILIRINQSFHYGMAPVELYDVTRGSWVLGEKRNQAKYAFAVFDGIIQEVYAILGWFKAGQVFSTRDNTFAEGRWEFVGNVASPQIRDKYINKSVSRYFPKGGQNPIAYVNIQ